MPINKNILHLEIKGIKKEEISFKDVGDLERKKDGLMVAYNLKKGMDYLFFTRAESKMNNKNDTR